MEIVRGQRSVSYPARGMLVAACNDCPCGRPASCRCSELEQARYMRRLSGPLLDRIDLVCQIESVPAVELVSEAGARGRGSSSQVRQRVGRARDRQRKRLASTAARCNADMDGPLTRRMAGLTARASASLLGLSQGASLSGRGYDRVLRVARTIADLDGRDRGAAGRRRGGPRLPPLPVRAGGGVTGIDAACPDCVRHSLLIGRLAPRIAGLLGEPPHRRKKGVLALDCHELIDTLVPSAERGEARRWIEELDVDAISDELAETGIEALCVHHEPYPPALAGIERSATGAVGVGRSSQARGCAERTRGDRGGHAKAVALRPRDGLRARARSRGGRGHRGQRPRPRDRRRGPPRRARRSGQPYRRGRQRPRHPVSADEHRPLATTRRARRRGVRAAARPAARTGGASRRAIGSWPRWPR